MKKGLIILAAVLVITGLAVYTAAFAAADFDFSKFGALKTETNTYTVSEDFDDIEITAKDSDIIFEPTVGGEFSATCVENEKIKHTVSVQGGTLKITAVDGRKWYDHLDFFPKKLSVTVKLPRNAYKALKIDSGTGNVSVPETFAFESADITASTGDVEFGARVTGGLKIYANTGDINIRGVFAESVNLKVSTGDISAQSVVCDNDITVTVETGRTELTGVNCDNLTSVGNTGRIKLKDCFAARKITVERSTGDVIFDNSDGGEIYVKTSTGDVTGTLKTAKVFDAKASTGKVSVPDSATGGKCEIRTSTGDIRITIAEG